MIKLLVDTSCDLPKNLKKKYDITVIPFNVIFDNEQFKDKVNLTTNDFFNKIKTTKIIPKTSQINKKEWQTEMEKLTKNNKNELLVFCLSSTLSGTYKEALEAKNSINNNRIYIIDGGATLLTTGLIVDAISLINIGKTAKEIFDYLTKRPRQEGLFVVNDLNFLKKGGRINFTQAIVGGLLNIKPILMYNKKGKIISFDKARGEKKAFQKIIEHIKLYRTDRYIMISHANNKKGAQILSELVKKELKESPKFLTEMGPVISSHTGPGCIFISY